MPHPDHHPAALEVHHPQPLVHPPAAPLVPVQPSPSVVQSIVLPDGRTVTGYPLTPTPVSVPVAARPAVSRTAVNIALGGIGFGAVCGGLALLTTVIAALTAFITQLITLAAVIFGGWIAVQIFGATSHRDGGTTVNIRKAVIKRNHFHS
ncbi:hypothetical protein YWIDRAFT_01411 [Streptomyces sp. SceaMP-e96]|uniref:hypothetical protein n=1 Tax=unclassified Streptomyces TaxID=2593676 RepID=UPI000823DC8D|nr:MULTISPECIES: hypothetical protein [unclassified Streptomyces]MYT12173.1 hypothetical protein [Streptomyces sp. SID4951]SCK27987.1 hypothetical protein YWIDRAFT_01411 [Streptomyces sp. SceaMP-e96]